MKASTQLDSEFEGAQSEYLAWLKERLGNLRYNRLITILRHTPGVLLTGSSVMKFLHPSKEDWEPKDIDVFVSVHMAPGTPALTDAYADLKGEKGEKYRLTLKSFLRALCVCGKHDPTGEASLPRAPEIGIPSLAPKDASHCFHLSHSNEIIPEKYFRGSPTDIYFVMRPALSTPHGCWSDVPINIIACAPTGGGDAFGPGETTERLVEFCRCDFAPKEAAWAFDGFTFHKPEEGNLPGVCRMQPFQDWPIVQDMPSSLPFTEYEAIMRELPVPLRPEQAYFLDRIGKYVKRGYNVQLIGGDCRPFVTA